MYIFENEKTACAVRKAAQAVSPRVLFVCLGNICRSPAAHGIMEAVIAERGQKGLRRIEVDSAGTGNYHTGDLPDRRMIIHARRRGYELTHRARQVRTSDFRDFDLIVAMDDSNFSRLKSMAPDLESEAKIVRMVDFVDMPTRHDCIPDPYYEGAEGFETVLDLLENGIGNLYASLRRG